MSQASLRRDKQLLEDLRSIKAGAIASGITELIRSTETINQLEYKLQRKNSWHSDLLDRVTPRVPEREFPHLVDGTLFLPRAAEGNVPMLRASLQRMFPAYYPERPWLQRFVADVDIGGESYELRVSGNGLSVEEADVLMAALSLADGRSETVISVSTWQILRMLGRSFNSQSAQSLQDQFKRLTAHHFICLNARDLKNSGRWSILRDCRTGGNSKPYEMHFVVDNRFAQMFVNGFKAWGPVDMIMRAKIDGRAKLARWLFLYLCGYPQHHSRDVAQLLEFSNASKTSFSGYRRELINACSKLENIGFLKQGSSRFEKQGRSSFILHTQKILYSPRFLQKHNGDVKILSADADWPSVSLE
ncbi:hypothetical protein LNV23_22795 [Paucibacter sp. DJ1R-11]|uniref:hypothetical protein n=1 Tax=Paucibacter sp. DJ1R-11 TaxID=2893556 RepID=UPI0021E4DB60|nr:hypothetical protein [Paucibacter sp. DJ1R-11]MCV2366274.1 hypothetical protein [Paucibacter sp. DJ1R-11]